MPKSLSSRLEKLEASQPEEPLVVRITSFADPPTAEEETFLEAHERRRIEAGENLVVTMWSGRQARNLDGLERQAQAQSSKLAITITRPDGRRVLEL
jgi:hypothetical protein